MYVAVPSPSLALFGALGADALGHVVYGLNAEAVGVGYIRNWGILQAERTVAHLAVEMYVTVIIDIAVGMAQLIAHTLAAVINLMEQVMLLEEAQRAEYAGLVNGVNGVLQLGHGDGVITVGQCLEYDKAVRGWLDAMLVEYPYEFLHLLYIVIQKYTICRIFATGLHRAGDTFAAEKEQKQYNYGTRTRSRA